jgi:glucose/arabinose dehydrogenase
VPDLTQPVPPGYCEKTEPPVFTLPAHYAPLGLAFYTGEQFPQEYQGDLFISSHGSWDRKVYQGYKLLRVRFRDNQPDMTAGDLMVEDFVTGWLTDPISGAHWGRPVDPLVGPDGSLYVTDDASMSIYRIYYRENAGP